MKILFKPSQRRTNFFENGKKYLFCFCTKYFAAFYRKMCIGKPNDTDQYLFVSKVSQGELYYA